MEVEEVVALILGEAVPSKVNTSTKLLTLMTGMLPFENLAVTSTLTTLLTNSKPLVTNLQTVDGQTRKKVQTTLSDEMKDEMNKVYRTMDGAAVWGKGQAEKETQQYAKDLEAVYVPSSKVFKNKGTFINELRKALAKLDSLPEELFVALHIGTTKARLETMMADYDANFVSKVDKTVQTNGTVKTAFTALKKMYSSIIKHLQSVQDENMPEHENKFVTRFNQVCTEYSSAQKVAETARKKAQEELAKKKAEEAAAKKAAEEAAKSQY